MKVRKLAIILGDQLNLDSAIFKDLDRDSDLIWIAETQQEFQEVWSSKMRISLFLAARRHFVLKLEEENYRVQSVTLNSKKSSLDIAKLLEDYLDEIKVQEVTFVTPASYQELESLSQACQRAGVEYTVLEDDHFLCSKAEFAEHASGRKQLRMEYFYREMRKRYKVLMNDDNPEAGKWNFDKSNRKSFGKAGPELSPARRVFEKDEITLEVLELVEEIFSDHPGDLDDFNWPVSRTEALQALDNFIELYLENFGAYQDAMWIGEPFLNHSLISSSLNLKLLHPREVIEAAEKAYRNGKAPIESVEGFIRQILGWREFVRGVYWLHMPDYLERNGLKASMSLPDFYWTGESRMRCMSESIKQTLRFGYAHHIQRLMVTGTFALMFGVDPKEIHKWYLAVYVDAHEWVELPNTLGMSQYADYGVMASKPYVASGKYIQRMSNYCVNCDYDPAESTGDHACPFTTLYWDFLMKHEDKLEGNNRMRLQIRNLSRLSEEKKLMIVNQAKEIRKKAK